MTDNASEECIRLSKRLKSLRQARGFKTARSFASKLDIHENRYTRYERAEVEPDLELLVKFCSVLRITPNDLLSETIELASEPASAAIAASGFQESGRLDFTTEQTGPSKQPSHQLAAEVMALSTLLAEISVEQNSTSTPATPADTVKLSGELYQQIMESPFSVLPGIGTMIPLHAADLDKQAQVAAQIKSVLQHYRATPDSSSN